MVLTRKGKTYTASDDLEKSETSNTLRVHCCAIQISLIRPLWCMTFAILLYSVEKKPYFKKSSDK